MMRWMEEILHHFGSLFTGLLVASYVVYNVSDGMHDFLMSP